MRDFSRYLLLRALAILLLTGGALSVDAVTPMISMGDKHGLALRSDGTVVAWGSDAYGQLGLGRSISSPTPMVVPGLTAIRSIGSGSYSRHTLAVTQNGAVWAWGQNDAGQLGDGTRLDRSNPVQVLGIANVVSVAGGWSHSIALKEGGTVWAWGNYAATGVVQVGGLTGIVSIAAGNYFSVALRSDGTVWAWGANSYGELGDGTTSYRSVPVQVAGLADMIAIGAGDSFGAALKRDGSVWEWGIGAVNGSDHVKRLVPERTSGVSGAVSLSVGGYGVTAIRPDGGYWRWLAGRAPTLFAGASGIGKAVNGNFHTLLLTENRAVLGFGANETGQLGDGTFRPPPTGNLVPVANLSNVVALAAGLDHSAALDAGGNVWTWGSDTNGQLGRGAVVNRSIPTLVPGLTNVVQVSAGAIHSAAVKQDGSVWVWGNGVLRYEEPWIRTSPVEVKGVTNVLAVAAGVGHTLALKQDGTLWAWGDNYVGALGNGGVFTSTPIQVPGMTGVIAIAAGSHSLAVKQDGTLWAWGGNDWGQLGLGTVTTTSYSNSTQGNNSINASPTRVPGLANIRAVAAANGSSYAVDAEGTAWAWGSLWGGELPGGGWVVKSTPAPLVGLSQVRAISAKSSHALAYRSDGTVWGWGLNPVGALGALRSAVPAPLAELGNLTQVSAGESFSAFLRKDGLILMLGDNGIGQLGNGTFAQSASPKLVVNDAADGFLNLNLLTDFEVPPRVGVPFFVVATGGIAETSASVNTTTKFNASDIGKSGAVFVTATVPEGTLGAASSTSSARSVPRTLARAGSSPSAFTLIQLTSSGWQPVVSGQLIPYASGVLGDQLAAQSILNGTDTTNLKGAQFCLGYGTSADQMVASGTMRVVATIPDPNAAGVVTPSCLIGGPAVSYGMQVISGWNLLGNSLNQSIAVASLYGDSNAVNTVWKWDPATDGWQFYTPSMDASALQAYATSKGYAVLREIKPGEGYWLNARVQPSPGAQSGASFVLTAASLAKGWNLSATGLDITPSVFNANLKSSLPGTGVTTLWAWDAPSSRYEGCPCAANTPIEPCSIRRPTPSAAPYTSGVSTSSSVAFAAAIVSGLPLNVPIWSYTPSVMADMTSSVPPMAPHGSPPPNAFAKQTMSGVTPNRRVAPPQPTTSPVFTSSNARNTPCALVRSRTPSR